MTGMERIVIVGGVAAGMSAASKVRRASADMDVVVFERGSFVSYSACGLPWFICGMIPNQSSLIARSPEQFAKAGVKVNVRHEVTEIDAQRQRVKVRDLSAGSDFYQPYDRLLIATGSQAVRLPIPGFDLPGVFQLRTLEDGIALRSFVQAEQPKRAVIVGGGYIGLEVVECFKALGMDTTVVDIAPRVLMTTFDADMSAMVETELAHQGVTLSVLDGVAGFEGKKRVTAVVTQNNRFPADVVVVSLGIRPNTALAQSIGVRLGQTGAIAVDDHMRTNVEGVYSGGDCAEAHHVVTGQEAYIPLGSTANKQGRTAGANMAGGDAAFRGVVGTAVSKVFGLEVARTGLTEEHALQAGYGVRSTKVDAHAIAAYFPGATSLTVKLVVETDTGRLLGGQIIGPKGAAKRIDVLATALHQHMTIDDLRALDMSYAPPFAPVWDPILVAANVAAKD